MQNSIKELIAVLNFKALIFLDYFARVIDNDYSVCDNLENLSKVLRDQERARDEDKGEKGFRDMILLLTAVEDMKNPKPKEEVSEEPIEITTNLYSRPKRKRKIKSPKKEE